MSIAVNSDEPEPEPPESERYYTPDEFRAFIVEFSNDDALLKWLRKKAIDVGAGRNGAREAEDLAADLCAFTLGDLRHWPRGQSFFVYAKKTMWRMVQDDWKERKNHREIVEKYGSASAIEPLIRSTSDQGADPQQASVDALAAQAQVDELLPVIAQDAPTRSFVGRYLSVRDVDHASVRRHLGLTIKQWETTFKRIRRKARKCDLKMPAITALRRGEEDGTDEC